MTDAKVRQAVRSTGVRGLGDIAIFVQETNGKLNVIPRLTNRRRLPLPEPAMP